MSSSNFVLAAEKQLRRRVHSQAIAIGVVLLLASLVFCPPVERALGGLFAHSGDGVTIAEYPDKLRQRYLKHDSDLVGYTHIPRCLRHAIISVEDKRFFAHGGIDAVALVRVILEEARNDHFDHGGSTITQQLARIILDVPHRQLSVSAEVVSQIRIMRAALIIEHDFSKQAILDLYLNGAYFGRGATGAAAAAHAYFNRSLQQLDEAQCIYMAGLLQAPTRFGNDPSGERSTARYRHVIATMKRNGYLTRQQADTLRNQQLLLPKGRSAFSVLELR